MSSIGTVAFNDPEIEAAVSHLLHSITARASKLSKSGTGAELILNINSLTLQVIEQIAEMTINAQALATTGLTRDDMQKREDESRRRFQ